MSVVIGKITRVRVRDRKEIQCAVGLDFQAPGAIGNEASRMG